MLLFCRTLTIKYLSVFLNFYAIISYMIACDLLNNFSNGDFLYGRQDHRKLFISQLRNKFSGHECCKQHYFGRDDSLKHPVTIDGLNNPIIFELVKLTLERKTWLATLTDDAEISSRFHNPELGTAYYRQVFLEAMPAHTKISRKVNVELNTNKDSERMYKILISQACKANFYNNTRQGIKFHFIIEKELLEAALGFTQNLDHFKAFTAKELRFIYKHWADLSNKVIFYTPSGNKTLVPWEDKNSPLFRYWLNLNYGNTKSLFHRTLPNTTGAVQPLSSGCRRVASCNSSPVFVGSQECFGKTPSPYSSPSPSREDSSAKSVGILDFGIDEYGNFV
jgi:hypothetical protein